MLNGSTQAEKSGRLHKGNAHIMRSLTRWQIDQIIDEFIEAAERAEGSRVRCGSRYTGRTIT